MNVKQKPFQAITDNNITSCTIRGKNLIKPKFALENIEG